MKLQFLGHACFLLDDGVHKVLTDPFLTGAGRPEWAEKVGCAAMGDAILARL